MMLSNYKKNNQNLSRVILLVLYLYCTNLPGQISLGSPFFGDSPFNTDEFGTVVDMSSSGNFISVGSFRDASVRGSIQTYQYNTSSYEWERYGSVVFGISPFAAIYKSRINADGTRMMYGDEGGSGRVQVYNLSGNNWEEIGVFTGANADDGLGAGIDISEDGNRIVIGSYKFDSNGFTNNGIVQVYDYDGSSWSQVGSNISGDASEDNFGFFVSMNNNGDRIAVSAINNDTNGSNSGHVRIYEYNGSSWVQLGTDINGEAADDQFGASLALDSDGDRVVISSSLNDGNGTDAGHVRVYEYNGTDWIQLSGDIDGDKANDLFGSDVAITDDGNTIVVGAPNANGNSNSNDGEVKVYNYDGTNWIQSVSTIIGNTGHNEMFGAYVSVDGLGSRIVVGDNKSGASSDVGSVEVFSTLTNTFLATGSFSWNTPSNWSLGSLPKFDEAVVIPDNFLVNVDTENIIIGSITVGTSALLVLQENKSLTVIGDFIRPPGRTTTIFSGSSLIVKGEFTGDLVYRRTLPTNNWYLISSPVVGETIENLISNHTFATGTGDNVGLASYNNGASGWNYQTLASTGPIASGSGLSAKLVSAGDISFSGTLNTEDVVVPTASTQGFNLVGNPYPSYIAVNDDASDNLLGNVSNANALTELTIWMWNSDLGIYETINLATTTKFIAPGQGFFVSTFANENFTFTETMQSHQDTDSFQRSSTTNSRPEIELIISNDTQQKKSDIFYISGTTTGWDDGYDSTMFEGGGNESFSIYTHLLSDSQGQNLAIQSLPDSNYENMVIPVGVNAEIGTEITISATGINFPEGIDVYLEDKDNNSFTLLDDSTSYTTVPTSDLNGIGRFYLHTSSSSLTTTEFDASNLSVYPTDKTNLRVVGIQSGTSIITIYTILGSKLYSYSFEGSGTNNVPVQNIKTGLYIVQLQTEKGTMNKKIIIE